MAILKALELEDRLQEAAQTPVCALVGGDDSMRSRCLRLLKDAAAPPELPGSTVRRFEDVPEARDVFDELRTLPFMGLEGRRVVVVERGNAFLQAHGERLIEYLKHPSRTATLILCLEEPARRRRGRAAADEGDGEKGSAKLLQQVLRAVQSDGLVVDCKGPTWPEAKRWARSLAERMGKKLTPQAVESLLEAIGPNLLALRSELEKLSAYVASANTITERDVGELVAQARSRSVFELAEAVGRGDAAGALRLCSRLLLSGESREAIISVLALQLRRLWQIKRAHADGVSEAETARKVGVPQFVVGRALKVLPMLCEERLARQFHILSAADVESKTTSLRSQEEKVWLEGLLARLCRP